jgi:hypothetical protein
VKVEFNPIAPLGTFTMRSAQDYLHPSHSGRGRHELARSLSTVGDLRSTAYAVALSGSGHLTHHTTPIGDLLALRVCRWPACGHHRGLPSLINKYYTVLKGTMHQ